MWSKTEIFTGPVKACIAILVFCYGISMGYGLFWAPDLLLALIEYPVKIGVALVIIVFIVLFVVAPIMKKRSP